MEIHNVEQGTDEWFDLRKGRMTGSHAQAIGSAGKGLETYAWEIVSESFSSGEREVYTNKDMERGNELEELAVNGYEMEKDVKVEKVGFISDGDYVGVSPDGLVGEDGMVEIKCPNDVNFFRTLIEKKIDSKYIWQMQMQLLVSGRKWCDFVAYNPNFKQSLLIVRVVPDPVMQEKLKTGLAIGQEKIKQIKSKYSV